MSNEHKEPSWLYIIIALGVFFGVFVGFGLANIADDHEPTIQFNEYRAFNKATGKVDTVYVIPDKDRYMPFDTVLCDKNHVIADTGQEHILSKYIGQKIH